MNKRLIIHNHFPKARDTRDTSVKSMATSELKLLRNELEQAYGPDADPMLLGLVRKELSERQGMSAPQIIERRRARDEVGRAVPREQEDRARADSHARHGIVTDMHPDELRDRIKDVTAQIAKLGPRVPMTDPLFAKLRGLKAELARVTGSGLTRGGITDAKGIVKQWTVAQLNKFDDDYHANTGEENKPGWYYQFSREDAPIGPFKSEVLARETLRRDTR